MQDKIAIIGLGYVGLPLAVEFSKHFPVIGIDTNSDKVNSLLEYCDYTLELATTDLEKVLCSNVDELGSKGFFPTSDINDIRNCNIYVVTVPTPIDEFKKPDLSLLISASKMIAEVLCKGDIVIYESTVYPGCTEEECVPVLEKISGLKYNQDFYCGYSPERINPGDKKNRLPNIKKVTSGSTEEIALRVDELYAKIIIAGTHRAPSIKVAEASKAIENAQRDVNISFMNELSLMFDRMEIDTNDVLEAAGTKWNFLPFKPGLVGGHCIGVDPYYLAHKAESLGYHPAVILSGRRVNDQMSSFVASKMVKLMIQKGHQIKHARVLVLGITFKENCPDIRNTKVVDVYRELCDYNMQVDVYDPWANKDQVKAEYNIDLHVDLPKGDYEGVLLAVGHRQFLDIDFEVLRKKHTVIFDTKTFVNRNLVDARL